MKGAGAEQWEKVPKNRNETPNKTATQNPSPVWPQRNAPCHRRGTQQLMFVLKDPSQRQHKVSEKVCIACDPAIPIKVKNLQDSWYLNNT